MWLIFRIEIKLKLMVQISGHLRILWTCLHVWASASMFFEPSQVPSCLIFHIWLIVAVPTWNQIHGYSVAIVASRQGWINGSRIIIVEIPYFCLNHTKFVFNILIDVFVNNLRAVICVTTNHNCCSSIWYGSMTVSPSFEISMKWPVIILIFGNGR